MKVHELLAEPSRWTQGSYAKNKNGVSCQPSSHEACSWCIDGAMRLVYFNRATDYVTAVRKLVKRLEPVHVIEWNDCPGRTHSEVLALCRELDI